MKHLTSRLQSFIIPLIILLLTTCVYPSNASDEARSKGAETEVRLEVPARYKTGTFKAERKLKVPRGFKVNLFAAGLDRPRVIATGPDGHLYVSLPSSGKVIVLPDDNRDGVADREVVFAVKLNRPHGLAFLGKDLVVAETGRILLLQDTNGDLKADVRKVLSEDIPSGGGHWTKTVIAGSDGLLYISAGSSCNVCIEEDKRRASVLRLREGRIEVFAKGLRNSVGIAFHPETKELWGVDNGRDWLGDELPPEELNMIAEGGDYGWPYCYGERVPDQDYGSTERCGSTIPPAVKMLAHSAPLGIVFGSALKFPAYYSDSLYIAFHGSWNRTVRTGYKLVMIPFKNGKPAGTPVDFVTGWGTGQGIWGRPVYPAAGRDGALYVSDDYSGAIYRITYEK